MVFWANVISFTSFKIIFTRHNFNYGFRILWSNERALAIFELDRIAISNDPTNTFTREMCKNNDRL